MSVFIGYLDHNAHLSRLVRNASTTKVRIIFTYYIYGFSVTAHMFIVLGDLLESVHKATDHWAADHRTTDHWVLSHHFKVWIANF